MFLIITLGISCLILWFYIIDKKDFSFKESWLLTLLLILWYFLMTAISEKVSYDNFQKSFESKNKGNVEYTLKK